jgi:drug/metabolite transporter (DMT)-like permease
VIRRLALRVPQPGGSDGRAYGIALVAVATVLWSSACLFVRALDLDVWTMQGWRALFGALSLAVVVLIDQGRRAPASVLGIGRAGLVAVPISALSMIAYVAALKLTTVANVVIVYATVPFVAAALAWLWMGEAFRRRTAVASVVALIGIAIMAGSGSRPDDLAGDGLSFVMTLAFAVLLVMARRYPGLAMAPVNGLAAALCAALCWPLMPGGLPSPGELVILALFGIATTGLAYLLFLTGGRYLPSSEAGLIGLLEVMLGPLWVWLAFAERPSGPALLGGALVLASLLWFLSEGARRGVPKPAGRRA